MREQQVERAGLLITGHRPGADTPAIQLIDGILARGRALGLFRDDIDAIDVHMAISAFCCFRVANRHTFGAIFGRDLLDPPCATVIAQC